MHLTTISSYLLVASSLVLAHPSYSHQEDVRLGHFERAPKHHVPEQYLSLFDPAKHEHIAAELKSHQERIMPEESYRSTQKALQIAVPTTERLALKKNLANIRAQCKHADEAGHRRTTAADARKVARRSMQKSEAAGSSLFAASVFAIGGAIGVAALLL